MNLATANHTTPSAGPRRPTPTLELRDPTPADVQRLALERGTGLVTITLSTLPGPGLSVGQGARLEQLAEEAHRRLRAEPGYHGEPLWNGAELAAALRQQRTSHGLLLAIGPTTVEAFRLPHQPGDRVVVDPSYLTRDLVQAIWDHQPMLLLVVSSYRAQLYLSEGNRVLPLVESVFPMTDDEPAGPGSRGRRDRPSRDGQSQLTAFLRRVDAAMSQLNVDHPVLLLAPEAVASRMKAICRHPFLATVTGNRDRASAQELLRLIAPIRAAYLQALRQIGLQQLDVAIGGWHGAVGVQETWKAAAQQRIELLLVDPTFRWPGTIDGGIARPASDPAAPGVIDDVVDDIIEMTTVAGGNVCFVEPGDLGPSGIRAVLRR